MTPEERTLMTELCRRIQEEKDPKIFDDLVRQLYDLIEVKHERIHPEHVKEEKEHRPSPERMTRAGADVARALCARLLQEQDPLHRDFYRAALSELITDLLNGRLDPRFSLPPASPTQRPWREIAAEVLAHTDSDPPLALLLDLLQAIESQMLWSDPLQPPPSHKVPDPRLN